MEARRNELEEAPEFPLTTSENSIIKPAKLKVPRVSSASSSSHPLQEQPSSSLTHSLKLQNLPVPKKDEKALKEKHIQLDAEPTAEKDSEFKGLDNTATPSLVFIPALAKPFKKPSVVVKSTPLVAANSQAKVDVSDDVDAQKNRKGQIGKKNKKSSKKGTQENLKTKESRVGPSLRVKSGMVKFYRGSDEEDVDVPASRLRSERPTETFDSNVPWICVFCHLGPHVQRLGDLFGPYYVNTSPDSLEEVTQGISSNSRSVMDGYRTNAQLLHKTETWMHQDCALWAGGVLLIGTSIRGLDKAVYDASSVSCTICKEKGATIGCLARGCNQAAHFPCAQRMQWNLEDETFHSYCEAHNRL
jgi:hypothetical protein